MKKITVKELCLFAVMSAIYVILAQLSVGTNDFKIAFGSVAILMSALLMGPVGGFAVGAIGEFIHQMIMYGFDPTTVLWLLPYACAGLVAGIIAIKSNLSQSKSMMFFAIAIHEIIITALVTPVNYISAVIQGWGSWPMIAAAIPMRVAVMVARIVIYCAIVPILYKALKKAL